MKAFSHYAALCGLSQQASESDDRRHAGAVQEEERCQTLQTYGISVVRQIVWSLALYIPKKASKKSANQKTKHHFMYFISYGGEN